MAIPNDGSFLAMFQKNALKAPLPKKATPQHAKASTTHNSSLVSQAQVRPIAQQQATYQYPSTTDTQQNNTVSTAKSADDRKVDTADGDTAVATDKEPSSGFQPAKLPTDPKILALVESSVKDIVSHETNIVKLRNEHEGDENYSFLNTESQYYNYFIERIEVHSQADYATSAPSVASSTGASAHNTSTQESIHRDSTPKATGVLKNADGTRRKRKSRWGDAPANASNPSHPTSQTPAQPHSHTQTQSSTSKASSSTDFGGSYNESQEEKNFRHANWIHQQRAREMQETAERAKQLTEARKGGSKHMADYLPKEELEKFMRKAKAIRTGNTDYDDSEYQEHKIGDDNVGYHMVEKGGWEEGLGLGAANQGIKVPVKRAAVTGGMGLGSGKVGEVEQGDDEFDLYRKRMMLAYKFRPNPLNNPRRAYY